MSKKSSAKTGGATFTPRLPEGQRPEYPSAISVVWGTLVAYCRAGGLFTLFCIAVHPYFLKVVHYCKSEPSTGGLGLTDQVAFTVIMNVVRVIFTVLYHGGCELLLRLGVWDNYRFQRKNYQIPSRKLVVQTLTLAFVGQIIVAPFSVYYLAYPTGRYFGMPLLDAPLPDAISIFKSYCICRLFNDWFFYWAHRTFHMPALYAKLHKQHHSFTGTITIAAEFAGLPETILANQIPSVGGALFFGAHPLIFISWLLHRLQQTFEAHSGVSFYGTFLHNIGLTNASAAADHDHHHAYNQGNFGAYWLDYFCGTMDSYLALGGEEGYCKMYQGVQSEAGRKAEAEQATAK